LICDTTQAYDIRIVVFKYMTKIIKKVDRALKKMVRNMKTTMPSQTNNREKVRKHFQSSDLSIRNFKTQMGTCYISGLYRTNSNSNKK
jgi:cystathionine beta-lyase family protein involved in aluminum resistance